MRSDEDPRFVRSRQALFSAATDLVESGERVAQLRVTDVARRAGVSRPTFYQHFADVPDLVGAAALERMQRAFARIPQVALGESWTVYAHRTFHSLLTDVERDSAFYTAVLTDARQPLVTALVQALAARLLEESPLGPVIRRRGGADEPAERAQFLAAGVLWHVASWITQPAPSREPVDTVVERLADLLLGASGATPQEIAAVRDERRLAGTASGVDPE